MRVLKLNFFKQFLYSCNGLFKLYYKTLYDVYFLQGRGEWVTGHLLLIVFMELTALPNSVIINDLSVSDQFIQSSHA